MPYFNVDQLFELSFSGKLSYVLPESIKSMLSELESCLEITDSVSENVDRREYKANNDTNTKRHALSSDSKYRNRYDIDSPMGRDREKDKKKRDFRQKEPVHAHNNNTRSDEGVDVEWEMMRAFKATKIESKTGIEKTVNDIRIALNKISSANYDKQRDAVLTLVNGYFDSDEKTETNTRRISKAIFDIASTNKFYSEMYAKLYKELIGSQSTFSELLDDLVNGFMQLDAIPVYIDPDSDYDGFCAYSKACEIRKSTSAFLVNCLKLQLITPSRIADILCEFVKYVDTKRKEDGFSKCVEEVVENVYIIVTMCLSDLSSTQQWNEYILPKVTQFVEEKSAQSMSNRAVFKFMDVLEKI